MSRILLIGDSYLDGLTPFLPAHLNRIGWNPVELSARSGWSTRRWLTEGGIDALIYGSEPDLSVVMLGTNDEGAGGEDYRIRIASVARTCTMLGGQLLWITGFAGNGLRGRYLDVQAVLGATRTIDGSVLVRGLLEPEAIHPTQDGYKRLAPRIAAAVNSRWKILRPAGGSVLVPVAAGMAVTALVLWALDA